MSVYFDDYPGYIPGAAADKFCFSFLPPLEASHRILSHLNTRAMEMQHLGSHSLYAAHDLFLMAHQRDSQAHHVPARQDNPSIRVADHSMGQSKWDLHPQVFHHCE